MFIFLSHKEYLQTTLKKKRWPTQRQNDKQATTGRPKNSPPLTTCPCHQSLPLITRPERNRFLLSWTHLSLWHGCVTSLSQQGLTKKICWRLPEKFSVPSRNDVHQQIDFVFFTGWGHVDYWMCELGLLFFFHIPHTTPPQILSALPSEHAQNHFFFQIISYLAACNILITYLHSLYPLHSSLNTAASMNPLES